jgi:GntR family transcriptional regulator
LDFRLDKHSDLPVVSQLQVQIKIALLLGQLRPGDTLPSIRDVGEQLGIGRNFVLQAYRALEQSGILKLQHGKGVLVRKHLNYSGQTDTLRKTEELVREVLEKTMKRGLMPSAFARYLYHRAVEVEATQPRILYADVGKQIAADRAAYISNFWRITIPSISFDELRKMPPVEFRSVSKVLTNYIRFDEARAAVKNKQIEVIPLGLIFTDEALAEFSRLPRNSSVCFVFDDKDFPWLKLIAEAYKRILAEPSVKFVTRPLSKVKNVRSLAQSGRYSRILISNRVWENLPQSVRKLPRITRPQLHIDPTSLEEVRIKAGVIV